MKVSDESNDTNEVAKAKYYYTAFQEQSNLTILSYPLKEAAESDV